MADAARRPNKMAPKIQSLGFGRWSELDKNVFQAGTRVSDRFEQAQREGIVQHR